MRKIKYIDVKNEIFALGFENEGKYKGNSMIISMAINRAMSIITTEIRPIMESFVISHFPMSSICTNSKGRYVGKEPIRFSANNAVSYTFKCDGCGVCTIEDNNGVVEIALIGGNKYTIYKGFCSGDTKLCFSGKYSYNVVDLAIYGESISDKTDDIMPYGEYIRYDMKKLVEGFIGFGKKAVIGRDGVSRNIDRYIVENRTVLLLPREIEGEYTISCKKRFVPVNTSTSDDYNIEIDEDIEVLLPLLSAFYIWLDDDDTKAAMYRNEYETIRNSILIKDKRQVACVVGGGNLCL